MAGQKQTQAWRALHGDTYTCTASKGQGKEDKAAEISSSSTEKRHGKGRKNDREREKRRRGRRSDHRTLLLASSFWLMARWIDAWMARWMAGWLDGSPAKEENQVTNGGDWLKSLSALLTPRCSPPPWPGISGAPSRTCPVCGPQAAPDARSHFCWSGSRH